MGSAQPPHDRHRGPLKRRVFCLIVIGVVLGFTGLFSVWLVLANAGYAPRELANAAAYRASVSGPALAPFYVRMARLLDALDRPDGLRIADEKPRHVASATYPAWAGAQRTTMPVQNENRVRRVSDVAALRAAIDSAMPGEQIELAPGRYLFTGASVGITREGFANAPIVVRAARIGDATLQFDMREGFHVQAPYWQFENLVIRGTCQDDSYCEHAFHVTGGAHNTLIRNNRIEDFNAHIKVNGVGSVHPDAGVIERNTLINTRARNTGLSVTPIDIVTASNWRIEANLIADFVKLGGNQVTYGAFAKGAGAQNIFTRNVVLCEYRLRGFPGQHIGLSLGGGGTSKGLCRDGGQCVLEQSRSEISYNLVQGCSDAGIYLNKAAESTLAHNTLLDTAGVLVRFPESAAHMSGNIVDGAARVRDDGVLHQTDDLVDGGWLAYVGLHPTRRLFADMPGMDLRWRESPPSMAARERRVAAGGTDLCGRPADPGVAGAFADFRDCLGLPTSH